MDIFDDVIVGAGSASCVLGNRLSGNRWRAFPPDFRRGTDRIRIARMSGKLQQQRRKATRYDKTVLSFEHFLDANRGRAAGCGPRAEADQDSRASTALAAPSLLAGFWPVISWPSTTTCGAQSGPFW